MKSFSRRFPSAGFTLIALLVIVAVVALLAAILLPWLAGAHDRSRRIQCVNNLKQCGLAFRIWEGDNNDRYPMDVPVTNGGTKECTTGAETYRHFKVMSNELSTPKILVCPNDDRAAAADFVHLNNSHVSYFVGLDAKETDPQMLLAGDRNITGGGAPEKGVLKLVPGEPVAWTSAIHNHAGNVGLADGSVQQFTSSGLFTALKNSGSPTNTWRLALPE